MLFMRYLPVLVLLTLFCFDAGAQKKLVIIGSSTSACANVNSVTECYVGRLRSYYNKVTPEDTTVEGSLALGGTNCYNGMPSSYTTSPYGSGYQPITDRNVTWAIDFFHPDVLLVNYPTNGYDVIRLDSILYCLRTIRDSANKKGVPCFVTTTQPRTGFPAPVRDKLRELKDSILLEMGAFAIDFWTDIADPADNTILPAYRSTDDIHLNAAGHDILYQRVLAKNIFMATLPAHFVQFNTQHRNNANIVTWFTDKEIDVDSYEIQRSADGSNFTKIGSVAANNIQGSNQYSFKDEQPIKGWNYYKVVIIDKNGSKHASTVMSVHINEGKLSLSKVIAPSSSQVIAELQNNEVQTVHLQLFNNLGMLITTATRKLEAGSTSVYLQTPALNSGVYHIKLTSARGESMVKSFIKN